MQELRHPFWPLLLLSTQAGGCISCLPADCKLTWPLQGIYRQMPAWDSHQSMMQCSKVGWTHSSALLLRRKTCLSSVSQGQFPMQCQFQIHRKHTALSEVTHVSTLCSKDNVPCSLCSAATVATACSMQLYGKLCCLCRMRCHSTSMSLHR